MNFKESRSIIQFEFKDNLVEYAAIKIQPKHIHKTWKCMYKTTQTFFIKNKRFFSILKFYNQSYGPSLIKNVLFGITISYLPFYVFYYIISFIHRIQIFYYMSFLEFDGGSLFEIINFIYDSGYEVDTDYDNSFELSQFKEEYKLKTLFDMNIFDIIPVFVLVLALLVDICRIIIYKYKKFQKNKKQIKSVRNFILKKDKFVKTKFQTLKNTFQKTRGSYALLILGTYFPKLLVLIEMMKLSKGLSFAYSFLMFIFVFYIFYIYFYEFYDFFFAFTKEKYFFTYIQGSLFKKYDMELVKYHLIQVVLMLLKCFFLFQL